MNRDQQQYLPRLTQCLWTFACASSLTLFSSLCLGQDVSDKEQASHWYQVEVVIFTQQGYRGNEQPPKKYNLDFQENSLELLDTDYIGNNYPIPDYTTTDSQRAIPVVAVEDPALTFSTASFSFNPVVTSDAEPLITPLLASVNDGESPLDATQEMAIEAEPAPQPEEVYVAEYEKPFIKLDKEFRDLNDSARALARRAKYNVVFHEAWRFAADENASDPWVIIKAGKQYQDRFEIEGSLRFYKSRFLHFQSDLWFVQFADPTDSVKRIVLPEFPQLEDPSLSDGQETLEVYLDESNIDKLFVGTPAPQTETSLQSVLEPGLETETTPQEAVSYPLSSLWVFDQSKRMEQQQSYYLDHPKMGILVTIKSHQVEITNPIDEELVLETATADID
jgi:hypothetical protein